MGRDCRRLVTEFFTVRHAGFAWLAPWPACSCHPLIPVRVQRLRNSDERPAVRGPLAMFTKVRSDWRAGRGSGSAFSGPRSRASTETGLALPRQHRIRPATAWATANGACARTPEPPAPAAPRTSGRQATTGAGRAAVVPAGAGPIRGRPAQGHGTGGVDEQPARGPRWPPARVGRRTQVPPSTCDHARRAQSRPTKTASGRKPPADARGFMRRGSCEARWSN
jgi:hypothetical protein